MTIFRGVLGAGAALLLLAACGGGGGTAASTTSPTSRTTASTSSSAPTTTLPTPARTTPAPTTPAAADPGTVTAPLRSYLLDAPPRYHLSTDSDVTNGPIDVGDFDEEVGTGAAARLGFSDGYSLTYDADATDESLEVDAFRFDTASGARAFAALAVPETLDEDSSDKPVRAAVAGLPGAVGIFATTADPKNGSDFAVVDTTANVAFLLYFTTDDADPAHRAVVAAEAVSQFRRLSAAASVPTV